MSDNAIRDKVKKILEKSGEQLPVTSQENGLYNAELLTIFQKIDNVLDRYSITLRDPLTDKQIQQLENALKPNKLPESLILIYKWHDGLKLGETVTIFPSMDIELSEYFTLLASNRGDEFDWNSIHFPLHTYDDQGIGYICMSCDNDERIYFPGSKDVKYASLAQMLSICLLAIEKNLIVFNELSNEWDDERFLRALMENENSFINALTGRFDGNKLYEYLLNL